MDKRGSYFFSGIGGSGMLPLAALVRASGAEVAGSDRAFDSGRGLEKRAFLEKLGIVLSPQDGSGITRPDQLLVTSTAVEGTVPDVEAAVRVGADQVTRSQLTARLFNASPLPVGIAGTSGKSTVTGMIAWILHRAGFDPTVINGAVMKNFATQERPFASALCGRGSAFVSEIDESDGSIELYNPAIAVLNNVSLDHKPIAELRTLFLAFVARAETAVLNMDDPEIRAFEGKLIAGKRLTFSLSRADADLQARGIVEERLAISFTLVADGKAIRVRLRVPGRHNVSNALAALATARAAGVPLADAAESISGFTGLHRRFELVGMHRGICVFDDFGHNPHKISATLRTLRAFPGRLLVLFQPHGFGPLKLMKDALVAAFAEQLERDDVLIIADPVYFGGTVERIVGSADIVAGVSAAGCRALYIADRAGGGRKLLDLAKPGDRIVVMGARDDSLSVFARQLLEAL